jgi:hypothetical protein
MRKLRLAGLVFVALLATAGTVFAASRVFEADLSGAKEVPPHRTGAEGEATFHLNKDGTELKFKLEVEDIRNVVQAHIHLGKPGENGPVVAFLYGPVPAGGGPVDGRLAKGKLTAANLIGPLAGHPLSDLVDAIRTGNAYVNVHTSNGSPYPGPGNFSGGEIRGQLVTEDDDDD